MFRLAIKNACDNRSWFVLTGFAVTLSVAFLTATLILTDSITGTADEDIAAAIATIVGITIIYNTFAIALAQRRRELALMRAIGTRRRQVLGSVMTEAAVVGVIATAIGLGVGIATAGGLKVLMKALGMTFIDGPTVISFATLVAGAAVGIIVTLASAWFPARNAARVAPIEALRDAAAESKSSSRWRAVIGVLFLGMSVGGLITAGISGTSILLVGALFVVPGLVLAGPAIVAASVWIFGPLLGKLAGIHGSMAARNLNRSPRRSASTALSLALGITMIAFFTVAAASFSSTVQNDIDKSLKANYVVTSATEDPTVDPKLASRLTEIDGVDAAVSVTQLEGVVDGSEAVIAGTDVEALNDVFDLKLLEGSLAGINNEGLVVVESGGSTPAVGDTLTVQTENGSLDLAVVAIVAATLGGEDEPTHFVDRATLTQGTTGLLDYVVYVDAEPAAEALIRDGIAATPGAFLETRDSFLASQSSAIDDFRNLVFAMLGLTVIIAVVGIANTTALSISERTREVGLLRVIGTRQVGVRRVIRLEAALLAIVGTAVGLTTGTLLAWSVFAASSTSVVSIPWLILGIVAAGGLVAGLGAAAYPAWRASKRPTLEAIAS